MKLNLEKALKEEGKIFTDIVEGMPAGAENYDIVFASPAKVDISFSCSDGKVLTKGTIFALADAFCDRCLDPMQIPFEIPFDEVFVRVSEDGEQYTFSGNEIDLDRMVLEAVSMEMPIVKLCKEDCKGLCPECGANRNHMDCGHEIINRRLSPFDGLAGLFEDNEEV